MKQCKICSKSISGDYSAIKLYCSYECRRKANKINYDMYSGYANAIPTGTVGTIAELAISNDLLGKGYSVFKSLSPASNFDLVAWKDKKFISYEVRTGYRGLKNRLTFTRNPKDKADYYAIFIHKNKEIIYIDPTEYAQKNQG